MRIHLVFCISYCFFVFVFVFIIFPDNGCIFLNTIGDTYWTGLPDGSLKSLLNEGEGVDYLAVTQDNSDNLYYYVRYFDGRSDWNFPQYADEGLVAFINESGINKLSIGLDKHGELQYAAEGMDGELLWNVNLDDSWFEEGWDECWLGNNGEYFVRGGGDYIHSRLLRKHNREVKKVGERVKRMFVSNRGFLLTYS